jgi:tellurite resistance protein TerC
MTMAKIARIAGGFALIIAGIAMLVLPGPGIITIVGGLALLAQDLLWAGRLRDRVKERFARYMSEPSTESDG